MKHPRLYGFHYHDQIQRVVFCRYVERPAYIHREAVLYLSDTLGM